MKNIRLIIILFVLLAGRTESALPQPAQSRFDELLHTIRTGNAYQRAETIPALAVIDDPRVVPTLMDLLKDEDSRVRAYTAQQLARLADSQSVDALAKALDDTNGNVRRYAAEGLLKVGSEKHIPALLASVMNNLPDPNVSGRNSWSLEPAVQAIGKFSIKSPPQLLELLRQIYNGSYTDHEDWWRLYKFIAECLGQIGDVSAQKELLNAKIALEKNYQDYPTWHAVCHSLAKIGPQKYPFDRPAADILVKIRQGKITNEYRKKQWVQPLSELGAEAVSDLDWTLQFSNTYNQQERCFVALEALGEIGGQSAAKVLRQYIQRQSTLPENDRRRNGYLIRTGLVALLKAEPNEVTAKEIILHSQLLDSFAQKCLVHDISGAGDIPSKIKAAIYENILLGSEGSKPLDGYARISAAKALGAIEGDDAIPVLIKVSRLSSVPLWAVAEAMGTIGDPRAIDALKDMALRDRLTQDDRLWIAAALARLDVDYPDNAEIVRKALPGSLEQAKWLHDEETVNAVAAFIKDGGNTAESAIRTLEIIGTKKALEAVVEALTTQINTETITDIRHLQMLCAAASRVASKLNLDSAQYYAGITTVINRVYDGFEAGQQEAVMGPPATSDNYSIIKRNAPLARKLWMAEATRRLDLAAKDKKEDYQSNIPEEALFVVEDIFGPELVPILQRITAESRSKVDFHGKYMMVSFYNVRSRAAKILTEKTGEPHTFIDVDGRIHPGGWNPSQEK